MKLSMKPTVKPFVIETLDGDVNVVVSKFTILDGERRQSLVNHVFDDKTATELDKFNAMNIARVMCSIKHADTLEYFWQGDVADFKLQGYEMGFINALVSEVDKMNPMLLPGVTENGKPESLLDTKKNES